MGKYRSKMLDDMTLRGLAERTQQAYLSAVERLAKHYRRNPAELSEADVQQYLLYLLRERGLSHSSCNLAVNGLKFFYRVTLERREVEFCLPRPKQPQRLPEILSGEEVARLFEVTANPKHRALLMSAYGGGLRVSEVVALRVTDIDSARMTIRVEQGKGRKDRYTLLSKRLLGELRRYWMAYRPPLWLFPRRDGTDHMSAHTAQKVYYKARDKAGIEKRCGIHGLRHAFATHLLESGVDVHTIQRLLGHGSIATTMRYFHLTRQRVTSTASPLDVLPRPGASQF
jgi:site-specific recombinase XerD